MSVTKPQLFRRQSSIRSNLSRDSQISSSFGSIIEDEESEVCFNYLVNNICYTPRVFLYLQVYIKMLALTAY
jgi:hypothetical protein